MKKVVAVVLNNFKNDSRVLKENISLQNAGYSVKVVALWEEGVAEYESVQNLAVHRIKLRSKEWSKNRFIQSLKYFEFLYRVIRKYRDVDIIHCNDLNALPVGVLLKLFFNKKIKIIYDAHEHESFRAGYSQSMQKITRFIEARLICYADKVITVSPSIANDYNSMYGIDIPTLILNTPFYKEQKKEDIFRKKFAIPQNNIIFLYQGGLQPDRGILEFAKFIDGKKNMSYVIMGYGSLTNDVKAFVQKSTNVFYHEAVSPEVLLSYTKSADIGVCIEKPICKSWDYALPNKMFEYLVSGLPIVVGGLQEMKKFVIEHKIGYILDIYTEDISKVDLDLIVNDCLSKQQNVKEKANIFNWQREEKKLLALYKDVVDDK